MRISKERRKEWNSFYNNTTRREERKEVFLEGLKPNNSNLILKQLQIKQEGNNYLMSTKMIKNYINRLPEFET